MDNQMRWLIYETIQPEVLSKYTPEELEALSVEEIDRLLQIANLQATNKMIDKLNYHEKTMRSLRISSAIYQITYVCGVIIGIIIACYWLYENAYKFV